MDNFAMFSLTFGVFSILFGSVLLIFPSKFSRIFDDYDYVPRMVGAIQILGGILTAGSVLMQSRFVAWFFVCIGCACIGMSWCIAYGLRTKRPKRKTKPKH